MYVERRVSTRRLSLRAARFASTTGMLVALVALASGFSVTTTPARSSAATPPGSVVTPKVAPPIGPSVSVAPVSPSAAPSASIVSSASASASVVAPPPAHVVSIGYARLIRGAALPTGIDSVTPALQGAMEKCYEKAIATSDDGDATVDVRLEIVGPGHVAAATIAGSRGASEALRECVRDAFEAAKLGASGPAPVVAVINLRFDRDVPSTHVRPVSACGEACEGEISEELRDEVRGHALAAAKCFRRPASPGEPVTLPGGSLEVLARIAGDGTVCGASTAGDTFGRPSLTTCLIDALSVPYKTKPGACVDVQIPLKFKGK